MADEQKVGGFQNGRALMAVIAVAGSLIFGVVAVLQTQIGNIADNTRQLIQAAKAEQEAKMAAASDRLSNVEKFEVRLRGAEMSVTELGARLEAVAVNVKEVDAKIQLEIFRLDKTLQMEIKFSDSNIVELKEDLQRIRDVMSAQAMSGSMKMVP